MASNSVIGIDLGATNIRVGRVRDRQLDYVTQVDTPTDGTVDDTLRRIYALIDSFDVDQVAGIGVGAPSVVDPETGVVYDVQNIPAWDEVPVKALLEERYGVPAFVNNDANCFALGEHRFGKGQGHDAMIGLILGTGFAGGVIIDGQLYAGRNCGAGEFGMMPYRDSVYEHYCAGLFFERRHDITGAEAYRRAQEGDADALAMFREMGHHLGMALQAVLYAYDPELLVFGGSVRNAWPYFEASMWEALETFVYPRTLEHLTIEISELDHVAILGAAALVPENEW